jgi:anaerobic magnesium-protoporphyrin IX monomethyl ester cyclase
VNVVLVSPVTISRNLLPAPAAGIAVLADVLKRNRIPCRCIDCNFLPSIHTYRFTYHENIERKLLGECLSHILASKPDVVGISSWGSSLPFSIFLSNALRQFLPRVPIILGGILSDRLAQRILQVAPSIDAVVLGEGDVVILEILQRLSSDNSLQGILGTAYRKNGTIKVEPPRKPLPVKYWGKTDYSDFITPRDKLYYFYYYLEGSRGCAHNCVFCCLNGQPLRRKKPAALAEELQDLVREEGATQVNFADNLFPLDGPWINSFCDLVIKKGLKVSWRACARVDQLALTTIRKMARSGCRSICLGVESTSPYTLRFINKSPSIDSYISNIKKNIEIILDNGIDLQVSTIIGFPYEGIGEIQRSAEFALQLQQLGVKSVLGPVVVLPGSRFWEMYIKGEIELCQIRNPKIRRHEEALFSSYFRDDPYLVPFGFLPKHKFIEQDQLEFIIWHYMELAKMGAKDVF